MQNENAPKLVQYAFDKDTGARTGGCMVATNDPNNENGFIVGYSFKHPWDRYNKKFGYESAVKRMHWFADAKYENISSIPYRHKTDLYYFIARSFSYFKNKTAPEWVEDFINDDEVIDQVHKESKNIYEYCFNDSSTQCSCDICSCK